MGLRLTLVLQATKVACMGGGHGKEARCIVSSSSYSHVNHRPWVHTCIQYMNYIMACSYGLCTSYMWPACWKS